MRAEQKLRKALLPMLVALQCAGAGHVMAQEAAAKADEDLLGRVKAPSADEQATKLKELVDGLRAGEWAQREQASVMLRAGGYSLAQIEGVLRSEGLTPEQRERLTQAGLEVFRTTDRGAMGVQFAAIQGEGGVTIGSTQAGFHSQDVLEPGDVLISIEGERIGSLLDIRASVISRDPGEVVAVEIVRDGEPKLVRLRLGSYQQLRTRMDAESLQSAWEARLRRVMPAAQEATVVRPFVRASATRAQAGEFVLVSRPSTGVQPDGSRSRSGGVRVDVGGAGRVVTSDSLESFTLSQEADGSGRAEFEILRKQLVTLQDEQQRLMRQLTIPNLGDAEILKLKQRLEQVSTLESRVRKRWTELLQAQPELAGEDE